MRTTTRPRAASGAPRPRRSRSDQAAGDVYLVYRKRILFGTDAWTPLTHNEFRRAVTEVRAGLHVLIRGHSLAEVDCWHDLIVTASGKTVDGGWMP